MNATKTTKNVMGADLKPGMRYWNCGGLYEIKSVELDGNRYLVQSKWVGGAHGDFFPNDFCSGLRVDLPWTVEC